MRIAAGAAGFLAAGALALVALHVAAPQTSGPLALTQIIEPYLILAALVGLPLAIRQWPRWPLVIFVALLSVGGFRYGPALISLPQAEAPGGALQVVTWNLLAGPRGAESLQDMLAGAELDLVGLQELQFEANEAIESEPSVTGHFPYRLLRPHASVLGMGLLSRHPVIESQTWTDPPLLRAVVQPQGRAPVTIFVGHPLPATIQTLAGLPVGVDTLARDRRIQTIREQVDRDLAAARSVLLIGDFNVTLHEPAYAVLAAGLRDAHVEAGLGPGFTWRPARLAGIPVGVLRIDYILTSPDFAIGSVGLDCTDESDHCRLSAEVWRQADAAAH